MNFTYVDLEMNQPSRKIIEIGWCIADPITKVVACRGFQFINPGEPIAEMIQTLCRIKQSDIDEAGEDVKIGAMRLLNEHRFHESFMNPVTWGGSDVDEIKEQVGETSSSLQYELNLAFGRRWIDVKTINQAYLMGTTGKLIRGGLAKSMVRLGLKFEGTKHRAIDDAYNTFLIHAELLRRMKGSNE